MACTVSRRVPPAIMTVVSSVPPETVSFSTRSTHTCMVCTGLESLVPATMCTGELTVALFAGVQMVTEGDVLFSVHGGVDELVI